MASTDDVLEGAIGSPVGLHHLKHFSLPENGAEGLVLAPKAELGESVPLLCRQAALKARERPADEERQKAGMYGACGKREPSSTV